jgi:hypothetical protein
VTVHMFPLQAFAILCKAVPGCFCPAGGLESPAPYSDSNGYGCEPASPVQQQQPQQQYGSTQSSPLASPGAAGTQPQGGHLHMFAGLRCETVPACKDSSMSSCVKHQHNKQRRACKQLPSQSVAGRFTSQQQPQPPCHVLH